MKVLALTSEPIDAGALRSTLGEDAADAEVMVVSPALQDSSVRFWVSDSDDAIARAQEVADQTVARLEEDGVDAVGDTGESEPLVALQDALATFDADRVVIFTHEGEDSAYREQELTPAVEQRFGLPVAHATISR